MLVRTFVPLALYGALVALMVLGSDAPWSVHALAAICLALALLVPAWLAAGIASWWRRLAVCVGFSIAAMLLWDAAAHQVIKKAEPFRILQDEPTAFLIATLLLSTGSGFTAWLATPGRKPASSPDP